MAAEKKLWVGTGFSESEDPFKAAKDAAESALKGLEGRKPTISYVFFAGDYDPQKLNEGLKSVLGGTEFIGGSADAVFYDETIATRGVVITSLFSNHLHVGIASSDNITADPYAAAKKTTLEALSKLPADNNTNPYQGLAGENRTDVRRLFKIPPFFVNMLPRGMKLPRMGDETKMIKGITEELGLNVPIWGGSFGPSIDDVFLNRPYEIYALHSGKIMKDGLIIAVSTSSLLYSGSIAHGCKSTGKSGIITKTIGDGLLVAEISGEPAADWYSRQLGIDKKKFIEETIQITQRYPIGVPDPSGNYMMRGVAVYANGALAFNAPFVEGWLVYIMDAAPENLLGAADEISKDITSYTKEESPPAICLAAVCSWWRVILKEKLRDELRKMKANFKGAPLAGYLCFGETGAKPGNPATLNYISGDVFVLYDKLL